MSEQLVTLAIEQISRSDFETWVQQVLSTTEGLQFAPTGGVHDGGQDGFVRSVTDETSHYVQVTKQQDTRAKVRSTIEDIRKTRELKRLTFVTSQLEAQRDLIEARWSKEFNVRITIHDQRWLLIQATLYEDLEQSLFGYTRKLIDSLAKASNVKRELNFSDRLSVVTYLESQALSLPTSENFHRLCLDSLIYDSLIDTVPDKGIFRTEAEIIDSIAKQSPQAISKSGTTISDRLAFLSSKANDPRIRKHPPERYALPYEVRNDFDQKNLEISQCEDAFVGSVGRRFDAECGAQADELREYVIPCIRHSVIETFRQQGLNFVASLSGFSFDSNIEIFSIIDKFLSTEKLSKKQLDACRSVAANVFRRICFSSNEIEREYLSLLMKYFSIKFVMDGDVAVTQYFSEMARRLHIYLGTDIIVRCLSETFVRPSSRGMTNALKILQSAGVDLRITRQTLNEVFSHLHTTYLTFQNHYQGWYRFGSLEEGKNSDRILIRAFFYAYFEPENHTRKPHDWSDFLNQMGRALWFAKPDTYQDDFGSFLVDKFGFKFVEIEDTLSKIDNKLANRIAQDILDEREKDQSSGYQILALNDAQMGLLINAQRAENSERVTGNLYGFDTWWMTEETRVLRVMRKYNQRADVVMHPQFLINHYMLDPRRARQKSVSEPAITPTLFGLRITDRASSTDMNQFLKAVGELGELDEAASRARIRTAANTLKASRPR